MSRSAPANQLPNDVMDDMRDMFNTYEKDGFVNVAHFKNILHNMGFHLKSKKEMDDDLRQHSIDLNKDKNQTFSFEDVKTVVTARMMKNGGREEEAQEAFSEIDTKNKGYFTPQELKNCLKPEIMGFNVTDAEIEEFFEIAGAGDKKMKLSEFTELYNS